MSIPDLVARASQRLVACDSMSLPLRNEDVRNECRWLEARSRAGDYNLFITAGLTLKR